MLELFILEILSAHVALENEFVLGAGLTYAQYLKLESLWSETECVDKSRLSKKLMVIVDI